MNKKKVRLSFSYILINGITLYRLLSSLFLLYLILDRQLGLFRWLLAVSFFTDAIDGFLARKFKVVSILGSRMDSIADDLTILVAIIGVYFFKHDFLEEQYVFLIILLVLFLVQTTAAIIRYRKFSNFHTLLAKIAAVLQGSFLILIFFLPDPPMVLFYFTAAVTAIELIEEIILVIILPRWQIDIKGIYWILKKKSVKSNTLL